MERNPEDTRFSVAPTVAAAMLRKNEECDDPMFVHLQMRWKHFKTEFYQMYPEEERIPSTNWKESKNEAHIAIMDRIADLVIAEWLALTDAQVAYYAAVSRELMQRPYPDEGYLGGRAS
jgi:hypothetical protein